jgi:diphthine synthase
MNKKFSGRYMATGSLVFVGLGLYDEWDISLKGLEEIKQCDRVFAEFYTADLTGTDTKRIEKTIGKHLIVLSRKETEKGDKILKSARNQKIVFLTCGDPMTATTHIDLRLRAVEKGIKTRVVHASSIITAVPGLLGLQYYKFGRTTTLAFPKKEYFPTSPYNVISDNIQMGLHTLVLLDVENENKKYMTAHEAMKLLLRMEKKIKKNIVNRDSIVCVVARAGSSEPVVMANTINFLLDIDFGPPLQTLVIPGQLHFMEVEALVKLAGLPPALGRKLQKL